MPHATPWTGSCAALDSASSWRLESYRHIILQKPGSGKSTTEAEMNRDRVGCSKQNWGLGGEKPPRAGLMTRMAVNLAGSNEAEHGGRHRVRPAARGDRRAGLWRARFAGGRGGKRADRSRVSGPGRCSRREQAGGHAPRARSVARRVVPESGQAQDVSAKVASRTRRAVVVRIDQVSARKEKALPRSPP